MTRTVFGDVKALPLDIYKVETASSSYTVSVHEERGRKYALVRGAAGTDREHVVVRDSDPRIGDRSLFEVHYTEWIGEQLDVATMRTSPITQVTRVVIGGGAEVAVRDPQPLALPQGMSPSPRIAPVPSRGTNIRDQVAAQPPQQPAPRDLARQVVAPDDPAALPYPQRHVRYAEDVATLLRSIHRRTNIFADVAHDRALRERLVNALDAAEALLAELRRRR